MNTVAQAVEKIIAGGVIAYPTEAVYGLGCDPNNKDAVMRLLTLKQRPIEKGLILIAASQEQFSDYIDANSFFDYPHVSNSWPGPNTWLMPCKPTTPEWLRGQYDTLAVRVVDHPIAAELCRLFDGPIVSTSANIADHAPALNADDVKQQFPNGLDCILDAPVGNAASVSIIRDAKTQQQIR